MKKGKIILFIIIILAILIGGGYLLIDYLKEKKEPKEEQIVEEYVPEEEINEEQLRQTIVSLYFINKETKEIMPEARLMDANILIQNPYQTLVETLIQGSKNDKLEYIIPKESKLLDANLVGNVVELNLSKEFLDGLPKKEDQEKAIQCIVNTLTELTEVDKVSLKIQGKDVPGWKAEYTRK